MCCSPCRVGIVVYTVFQIIAFLLILVGTPIDQFRVQNTELLSDTPCLTLWGWKNRCNSARWDVPTDELWLGCPQRMKRFRAAEALAIAAVLLSAVASLFGVVMLCCCRCLRWLCLLLNILGTGCGCGVTALMVDAYYNNRESGPVAGEMLCRPLRERGPVIVSSPTEGIAELLVSYRLGAGFILYIVGWCLSLINLVPLMMPC